MISSNTQIRSIALAIALALSGTVFGQAGNTSSQPQTESNAAQTITVSDGQSLTIEGIVTGRNAETFMLRRKDGAQIEVVPTEKTSIKIGRKGLFHRDTKTGPGDLQRGLRLVAKGKGNSSGQLVAESIRFDEADLRTAEALGSRVDPVEGLATSANVLAETNSVRIDNDEARISQAEQNAQRISGQVDELSSVASAAGAAAQKAQATADQAQSDAIAANQRLGSLDEYDVFKTVTVQFRPGSAVLSAAARKTIDEAAANFRGGLPKGWVIAVAGYADSTGKSAKNHSLSARRADAVITYLVTTHGLPVQRLVQPFGYGSL